MAINEKEKKISYAPKPIEYSHFCKFDVPEAILVCPNKRMLRLSDLEDIEGPDPFQSWIEERINDSSKLQRDKQNQPYIRQRLNR